MITLPVSLMSIRSTDGPTKPVAGAGEASFGEILDRQVDASPPVAQQATHDRTRPDAAQSGRGRVDVRPDDAPATPAGRRPDPRRDPMADTQPSHAIDPATTDATDTDIDIDTDTDTDTGGDLVDGDPSATDATAATVRHEAACPIAVPVDGGAQSLPAPSGQAPAVAAPVAEVAAVSGTAVPAAGSVAAAVDPLTTAAAALPSPTDDARNGVTGAPGASRSAGDDLPIVTNVTVETLPVGAAATAPAPTAPTTAPASVAASVEASVLMSAVTPAVPGGTAPTTFGASPASTPAGTGPGAPVVDLDAAPDAPTHPAIGDAGWVATPATPATPTDATPVPAPGQPTAATPPATPATAATTATATAPVATAAVAAAASAEAGPAEPRPRTSAAAAAGTDAPAPVTGAGSAPATAPGASAATTDAATADGLVSAPLRTSDIAAQAQRDAQIRRAEHLTRLGVDVTTDGLGAIRIEATNAGGGLQLNLGAERASTRHLLAEQVNVLRDELGANVSVDIGRGNTGQQSSAGDGDPRHPATSATHVVAPARIAESGALRRPALSHLVDADRGLDLHL